MANDKVVGEIINSFSKKSIEKANNIISKTGELDSKFKVSYFVTDENTKKYIKELGLDNPKKLVTFLVEVGFSAVEVVIGSVNNIQMDFVNDFLSKLEAIKEKIEHDLPCKDSNEKLRIYQNELIELRNVLEKRVETNIQRICEIDNMGSWERKIKAAFIRKNVDLYTVTATVCLKAIMEIAKIHVLIADYIDDENYSAIQNKIDSFMESTIFSDNHISLMNDWSRAEEQAFWNESIRKNYNLIKEQREKLLDFFTDIKKQQVDLENVVFV